MKEFLAVFTGSPDAFGAWMAKYNETERKAREQAGMKAWHDWMAHHAASIAHDGGPLGKTKRITEGGVADIRNGLGGFVVVRAETHEAAARLFENHPHFTLFPGDGVEVMEIMPVPQAPQ